MAWTKLSVRSGLLVVSLLWTVTLTGGDTEVSCVFPGSCALPCSFQAASEEVVHWIYLIGDGLAVHSYYNGKDSVTYQSERFRGRTSLVHDRISKGDASLRLSDVTLQDAGRYKCYTSTTRGNQESFINLKVEAPVRKVVIQLIDDTITCTSSGIYPQPRLTWSTEPPSSRTLLDSPTVQRDNQGLYNISSSLMGIANDTQVAHVCSVSSVSSTRSATVRQLPPILGSSNSGVSIPCRESDSDAPRDFNLSWSFNHKDRILSHLSTQTQPQVDGKWKERVRGVSEKGSLELRASTEGGHRQGTYTCELTAAEATYVTNTDLKIQDSDTVLGDQNSTGVIIGAVVGGVAACIVVGLIVLFLTRKDIIPPCTGNTHTYIPSSTSDDDCRRGGGDIEMREVPEVG